MAILKKHPKYPGQFQTGDSITAKVINDTIDTAIAANDTAENISADLQLAKSSSISALEKATDIETRANNGDFTAAAVETAGLFVFQVVDGNLVLCYSGGTAPDLSINASGELVFNI